MTPSDGFDVRSLAITMQSGARLSPHRHPWAQLVFATCGVMRVSTAAETWLTPATTAIWLPAGVEHGVEFRSVVSMRTLYVAPHRATALPADPATLEVAPLLRELILHIVGLGMLRADRPEHDRLAGVLVDLLAKARQEDLRLPLPVDPRAHALALRLQAIPSGDEGLARLVSESGASLRTLQRIFPRETGLTLDAWRQKARLIHSVGRLATGASVTLAALDSGYQNVSAFIVAFSRQFGMTPGRYRARTRAA